MVLKNSRNNYGTRTRVAMILEGIKCIEALETHNSVKTSVSA